VPLHPHSAIPGNPKEGALLWTIVVALLVLWVPGLVTSYTMGGLCHILLVIAIIMILVNVIQERSQ